MKSKKTILILDDEREYVELLKPFLEEEGYHVLTAHDGEAGLAILNVMRPDLVLLDINMPKKDGITFYREITTLHGRSKVPILVVTARVELKPLFKAIEADGFITKPFEITHLLKEIDRILNSDKEKMVFIMDRKELPSTLGMAEALRHERYRVTVVEDIESVDREMKAGNYPDFVITEYVELEEKDGNLISRLREILVAKNEEAARSKRIPIIVYTYSGLNCGEASRVQGADKYIGRPHNYTDAVSAIREFEINEK